MNEARRGMCVSDTVLACPDCGEAVSYVREEGGWAVICLKCAYRQSVDRPPFTE